MSDGTKKLHIGRSAAEVCRLKGWDVGTRLIGDEGYGPTTIEVTAIGEDLILAKAVNRQGRPVVETENLWSLAHRDWQVAP